MELSILTQDNVVINKLVYNTEEEKNNIILSIPPKFKLLETDEIVNILSKYDENYGDFIQSPPYIFFIFDEEKREWNPDPILEYNLYDEENQSFIDLDSVTLENAYFSRFTISLHKNLNPKYTWNSLENSFILGS